MDIIVIMKQTMDTEENVVLVEGRIQEDGVRFIMNPYDEYAVEEAVRLREAFGGTVTIVSIGPDRVEASMRTALAMGADQGVLVDDESLFGDEWTTSKVLASVIRSCPFDLILTGNMSVDNGSGQTGPRVAEELDIPHVSSVTKLTVEGSRLTVERDAEGDTETVELCLPALVTAQQGLNEPRYPSLPGIMKAKKKPINRIGAAELGVNVGEVQPKTRVIHQYVPPKRGACQLLDGDAQTQASDLVQLLRNAAKVI
ncbi:electron transfer flavoprotein subunit beta/FixA family protein [Paenibacillus naphthalenovorans]|uniref:electron transfer flavoprotein subunit beta/FixA family protein n=1 Tax=Paenibacillus naphthalenovorans TaxID=162209 RepID=UPI0010B300DC|nr:electron transfer flavoprotein subunit beta/FixA family protein [Paenibacillus naphthalenovorans]GCL71568.1 electron transfer flavoprotein subunit beta/FixA family protein [Paenibacillus naphthalenovorans]